MKENNLEEIFKKENENQSEPEEIGEFYFNPEDNSPPRPPRFPLSPQSPLLKRSRGKLWFLFLIFALVGLAVFAGYTVYKNLILPGSQGVGSRDVKIAITGPEKIASAGVVNYLIRIENKEDVALQEVELVIRFPEGFYLITSDPNPPNFPDLPDDNITSNNITSKQGLQQSDNESANRYVWVFSLIKPSEKTEITVAGQIFGQIGGKKNVVAELFYNLENFSSEFKEIVSFTSEITQDLVTIKIEGPEKALTGQEVEYLITLSSFNLPNPPDPPDSPLLSLFLKIFITYPKSFVLKDASPPPTKFQGGEYWEIPLYSFISPNLLDSPDNPGQSLSPLFNLRLSGAISGQSGEYKELKVRTGFEVGEEFILQTEDSFLTLVLEPQLDLSLAANELSLPILPLDWGDEINYIIIYKNTGQLDLGDVVLQLDFTDDFAIVDWTSFSCGDLQSFDNGLEIRNLKLEIKEDLPDANVSACELKMSKDGLIQAVTWQKSQAPALTLLKPGEGGELAFKISFISQIPLINPNILARVSAQAQIEDFGEKSFESNSISARLKTKITLNAEARYFTDEYLKIGSGPLPPRVGKATTYRIFWELKNTSNAVREVTVSTVLPDWAVWLGEVQTSVGELTYNQGTGQVTWTVPEVGAYAGYPPGSSLSSLIIPNLRYPHDLLDSPRSPPKANFEIQVTPREDQRGQYIVLTQGTLAQGTDAFTETEVGDSVGYLISELENDLGAMGKGVVE